MKLSDNPLIYLTKKMWEFSEGNRKNVIIYIILFFFASIAYSIQPFIIGIILNTIQTDGLSGQNIWNIILMLSAFIFFSVIFWIFHGPARVLERRNAFIVRANYRKYLINGMLNLPLDWHSEHHSGDSIDKIKKGEQGLFDYSARFYEVLYFTFEIIVAYVILSYFNFHSIYIVSIIFFIVVFVILKFDKVLVEQYKMLNVMDNKIAAGIFDSISNVTTIVILRIENLVSRSLSKGIDKPYSLFANNVKLIEIKWLLTSLLGAIMIFLVLASYVYTSHVNNDLLMVGNLFMLYGYVNNVRGTFYTFAYKYGDMVQSRTSVHNSEELSKHFYKRKKIKPIKMNNWEVLEVKNLNFSYEKNNKELHLENVTMSFKKGQKVAIVGESGSGKTTFMKLLRDLYHPSSVEVYLDGLKMDHGLKSVGDNISLIPQEPEIFNSTIKNNITLGVNYRMDHVKKYTDMATFTKVVNKLPNKFKSLVFEKGVNLSGGEKQRLALARGLLASETKPVVLLDESTSSVDPKNELIIYKNVFKKFKHKTIIASIHKLHLLPMFDYVYVLGNGKLVEQGTLDDLIRNSKKFSKMWKDYNISHKDELK